MTSVLIRSPLSAKPQALGEPAKQGHRPQLSRWGGWLSAAALVLPLFILQLTAGQALREAGLHAGADALSGIASAEAQDDKERKPRRKTRRTPAISNKVYERLADVQANIEAKEYDKALNILKSMESQGGKRALNSYELANLYNMYAFVYYSQENYAAALRSYQKVAEQPNIPLAMEINTRYTIAQLYFVMEQWTRGINALMEWFKTTDAPGAQAYVLLGQGYYQLKQYDKALTYTLKAINMFRDKDKVPREQWYNLARFLYFERNDIPKATAILEEMIVHYPKKQYWVQLSHMYGEARKEKRQLGAMESAYVQDLLVKDREQVNMSYLYLNAEVPYKAARVLDSGLRNDTVEDSARTLEVLGNAWRQAQEVKKSIPVLEKAAAKSDDGNLFCRLGSVYLDNEQYHETIKVNTRGLEKGDLRREDQCHLVLGMAYFNTKEYDKARVAFDKAGEDKRSRKYAQDWTRYMNHEIHRQKKLQEEIDVY